MTIAQVSHILSTSLVRAGVHAFKFNKTLIQQVDQKDMDNSVTE